jgi:hypothetical protein
VEGGDYRGEGGRRPSEVGQLTFQTVQGGRAAQKHS